MKTLPPVTVIETPSFLRDAKKLLGEDEQKDLISFLAYNPTAGDVIKGAGGVRKIRWARAGGGKSGGFRVIYFFHSVEIPLFALAIFAKNEKSNIGQLEKNILRELTSELASQYKGGKT
ncbi:MAG: type II toxin-antitoxin system RelE/ParE family toxin [Synergistaceae bacterium]|nr:type II toxin-antitoxin system RelE/ParE family toxin [Synergistaceae bacterium]